jgi:hypothetical protein
VNIPRAFRRLLRGLLVAFFAAAIVSSGAEPPSFIGTLSVTDKTAGGIARLTTQQVSMLDQQVRREISLARQGATVAFASTFTHRRTPMQRTEAGLDTLTTPELAQLDRLVAAALAVRPPPTASLFSPNAATTPVSVQFVPRKMEIHGEVTLAYVWCSGGGHGYGSSLVATTTDPSGKFSFTLGLSQFHGKGLGYPCDCDCDRGW